MEEEAKRAAVVRAGRVDNVILVGNGYAPPPGCELVALDKGQPVSPGDLWDGHRFTAAPAEPSAEQELTPDPNQVLARAVERVLADVQSANTLASLRSAMTGLCEALLGKTAPAQVAGRPVLAARSKEQ